MSLQEQTFLDWDVKQHKEISPAVFEVPQSLMCTVFTFE